MGAAFCCGGSGRALGIWGRYMVGMFGKGYTTGWGRGEAGVNEWMDVGEWTVCVRLDCTALLRTEGGGVEKKRSDERSVRTENSTRNCTVQYFGWLKLFSKYFKISGTNHENNCKVVKSLTRLQQYVFKFLNTQF